MTENKFSTTDFLATGDRSAEADARVDTLSREPVDREPVNGAVRAHDGAAMAREPEVGPLFADAECQDFRSRWDRIQIGFVDEPRKSVEEADQLVAATMKRLAEIFSTERNKLETAWDRGGDISTEDLRMALHRYRSFFQRLLKF
jgi:hypothetical protein